MFRISKDDRTRIVQVVAMSQRFHWEAGETGPFDAARVSMFLSSICASGRAAMFVAYDTERESAPMGFLVAQCGENYLTGELIAEETAIYVMKDDRRKRVGDDLYDAFERWAVDDMKVSKMRVTAQSSLRPEAVGRWFARRGFREAERSFIKEVKT